MDYHYFDLGLRNSPNIGTVPGVWHIIMYVHMYIIHRSYKFKIDMKVHKYKFYVLYVL